MTVGRSRELSALSDALGRVLQGAGEVVLLTGEAGVGKSHLLTNATSSAKALGFELAVGRCFADCGRGAYAPWQQALGSDAVAKLSDVPLGALDQRARAFEQVLSELDARADLRPLCLAIDDLHWADRDSLLLFQHVVRFGLERRLLLLGTLRDPDLDAARNETLDAVLAELLREPRATVLALRLLSPEEVMVLAADIASAEVPQALARSIHAETSGNPLYVGELTRHLLEAGKVRVLEGRVASDVAGKELGVPPSLRHLLRQRVAQLSKAAAALLRIVAASSAPLDFASLAACAELESEAALEACGEAQAGGLLRVQEGSYEASHAIVGRAVYENLTPSERAHVHRRIAEVRARSTAADSGEVATHYHASRELPGSETGVRFAIDAAERAAALGSHTSAAAFLELGIDLLPREEARTLAELLGQLALARANALDSSGALAALERARHILEDGARPERLAALYGDVARALELTGCPRSLWEPLVANAIALLGTARDTTWARLSLLMQRPLSVLAGPIWVSRFSGFDERAVALLREQGTELDFALSVDPHDARTAEQRRELTARALEFHNKSAAIRVLDACARDVFFGARDVHEAVARMSELLELSERSGSVAGQVAALVVLGCCQASLGEFLLAQTALQRALELSNKLGSMHRMKVVGPLALQTVLGHLLGDSYEDTVKGFTEFISSPRAASTPYGFVALNLGLFGAADVGDRATAERLFPLHLHALDAIPTTVNEWGAGRDCGASAVWGLGASEYAARYLLLCDRDRDTAGAACWCNVELSAARMHSVLGDTAQACAAFAQAREQFRATSRRPSLALCDYDEALTLKRTGGTTARAAECAAQALAQFDALGMVAWSERARALLQQLTHTSAPSSGLVSNAVAAADSSAALPAGLTSRETEVLTLLAGGFANKEIAAKLFISVPTVERHIANVYAKTGCRGRAAATAYALRHGLA